MKILLSHKKVPINCTPEECQALYHEIKEGEVGNNNVDIFPEQLSNAAVKEKEFRSIRTTGINEENQMCSQIVGDGNFYIEVSLMGFISRRSTILKLEEE